MKKCTANDKEQLRCNSEKLGCKGCYYSRTKVEILILKALEENNCTYEEMSKHFSKETLRVNIFRLRKEGYRIETIKNVGFMLKKGE